MKTGIEACAVYDWRASAPICASVSKSLGGANESSQRCILDGRCVAQLLLSEIEIYVS